MLLLGKGIKLLRRLTTYLTVWSAWPALRRHSNREIKMNRLQKIVLIMIFLFLTVAPASAQDGEPTIQSTDAFWEAAYWNNVTLSGEPALRRTESNLEFDWGRGSPAGGIADNNFSARWTRVVEFPVSGRYTFTSLSDDGVRVWVDDTLLVDEWHDHAVQTHTADVSLAAGHHEVKVEYYERAGEAVIGLSWHGPQSNAQIWRGEYFANRWFSGQPTIVRSDEQINFDWGYGAPAGTMPANQFAVRWTREIMLRQADSGLYRFTATADDGIRIWVDGALVISEWSDHPAQTFTADVELAAGNHSLKVEYYENGGLAEARLNYQRVTQAANHWRGEYFSNRWLSGEPSLVRNDEAIDFDWGLGAPSAAIPADDFSVRWTRTMNFVPGQYRFFASTDDGVRLWVNGNLILDHWYDKAASERSATAYLAGDVALRVEYYEHTQQAAAMLHWMPVNDPPPPPPPTGTVTVDEQDDGFIRGGSASDWNAANEGRGGHLLWTRNSDHARSGYNWGRWYASLAPGRYEVFAYIPFRYTTTSNARYWISHRDGYTLRTVAQSNYGDEWVSLGTYTFTGSDADYVSLADVTFEPYAATLVAYDAMRWDPR